MIGILALGLSPTRVGAQSLLNVAGHWLGTMDVTSEYGEPKRYTELVDLDQGGHAVTGSLKLSAAYPHPILHGSIHGKSVAFAIAIDGLEMFFHLRLVANRLAGYASCITDLGRVRAKVELMRVTDDDGNPNGK